jgi:hypothetical protein
MSDPSRPAPAAAADSPADQDATLESLLVAGLDLYFAGEYERAVHAWTRVLFIDRGHARARAYIERARLVLAERQRKADLLLHDAISAFDAGDLLRSRALLDEATAGGATPDTQALALRERLERLLAAHAPPAPGTTTPARSADPVPVAPTRPSRRSLWALVAVCGLAVALVVVWPRVVEWATADRLAPAPVARTPVEPPLPVPRASDLSIDRAKGLFSRGHLHEAATMLDGIRLDDPRREEADRLLADIQRVLLAGAVERAGRPATGEATGPAR